MGAVHRGGHPGVARLGGGRDRNAGERERFAAASRQTVGSNETIATGKRRGIKQFGCLSILVAGESYGTEQRCGRAPQ